MYSTQYSTVNLPKDRQDKYEKKRYFINDRFQIKLREDVFQFPLLVSSESEPDKVFILHGGGAVHLGVPRPEGVSESLDLDTAYYEVVQSQSPPSRIVPGDQVLGECRREPISNINNKYK